MNTAKEKGEKKKLMNNKQAATMQQLPNLSVNDGVNVSAASSNKAPQNRSSTSLMMERAANNLLPGSLMTTPRYEPTDWLKRIKPMQSPGNNNESNGNKTNNNDADSKAKNNTNFTEYKNINITDTDFKNFTTMVKDDSEPELDITISNVVCSFSVRCSLDLRLIARIGSNVEFRRENGMLRMKLRRPYTTASIWSSGRITVTGSKTEEEAKIAARRVARSLQLLGFNVSFQNYRVVNVLGTCSMPWKIKVVDFAHHYKGVASYEPELHPGVTYKIKQPKATLKIFSTGSITVTASCVAHVQSAIEHIYPLVQKFRMERSPAEAEALRLKKLAYQKKIQQYGNVVVPALSAALANESNSQESKLKMDFTSFGDGAAAAAAPEPKRPKMETMDVDAPLFTVTYNSLDEVINSVEINVNDLIEGPEDEKDC